MEYWGSGTLKMINLCKEQNLPEPEFVERKEGIGEFAVLFYKDIFNEEELRKRGLNERQIKAVIYVKGNGKITIREYKELYPLLSDKTLSRDLAELVKKGVLKEIGNKKGRKYEL